MGLLLAQTLPLLVNLWHCCQKHISLLMHTAALILPHRWPIISFINCISSGLHSIKCTCLMSTVHWCKHLNCSLFWGLIYAKEKPIFLYPFDTFISNSACDKLIITLRSFFFVTSGVCWLSGCHSLPTFILRICHHCLEIYEELGPNHAFISG